MIKNFFCFLIILTLSACSLIQKPTIEQGNVITNEMVSKLHPGLSQAEVEEILGHPVLVNIFTPNRLEYIYTLQTGHTERQQKRISLIFNARRLVNIHSDMNSEIKN